MNTPLPLRVAALVDLPRSAQSGGHVKCWERLAMAAATCALPLDLTVYFSGAGQTEILGPCARLRHLPPVFSTSLLKFLPYVPDHTDLAPYHPRLAMELPQYDVIHTTDGFFAFAQTAERVSKKHNIPLVTSFHTDTPSYTRIFTQQTIEKIFSSMPFVRNKLIEDWKIPERKSRSMEEKLKHHVSLCKEAVVTRKEDHQLAHALLGPKNVHHMRLGIDKEMFGPHRHDRQGIEHDYKIPPNRILVLFVGRVDVGKNIDTLIGAIENLIKEGLPLHLIVAGIGPALDDVKNRLAGHTTTPGFVEPQELGRLYASVDMLALSSEVEIRSMAGVEAMASDCPVLVSKKSGVAVLFNDTPAMEEVAGGVENWTEALRAFVQNPSRKNAMREAAATYSRNHLASWQTVLAEDLLAVWQKAANIQQIKAA